MLNSRDSGESAGSNLIKKLRKEGLVGRKSTSLGPEDESTFMAHSEENRSTSRFPSLSAKTP
jgi:hypothetical protein